MITYYMTPRCRACGCLLYEPGETGEYVCDGCREPVEVEDE